MKVIIEGELKEIAALELALKDGKSFGRVQNFTGLCLDMQPKRLAQNLRKSIRSQV